MGDSTFSNPFLRPY